MKSISSLRHRHFKQVDVFSGVAYLGNPLAVVLDGNGLSDQAMQAFARWTHLSETTFIVNSRETSADYRVRIFTPAGELPFAGHPTLGTCHAWLEAGGKPKQDSHIVQECALGLITIRHHGSTLAFAAPALKRSTPEPGLLTQVCAALKVDAEQILTSQWLDNGPIWLGLLLDSQDTVLGLEPDQSALKALNVKVGVAALAAAPTSAQLIARSNREARAFRELTKSSAVSANSDLEVRGFAAAAGIAEDPVTGSLNASLAQWLIAEAYLPERYSATQGRSLGRDGRVSIERDGNGQVWVGGECVSCIDGQVLL